VAEFDPSRTSTFSASERIMCSFLIESLNATPLNSIIYVARAALMLSREKADENEINFEEVQTLFSIAERLSYASKQVLENGLNKVRIDFSSLDYYKHLDQWVKMNAYDYYVPKDNVDPDNIDSELSELDTFDKLVYSTKNLTDTGYQHMCSDFLMYAIPKTQQWVYILTKMISPDTYSNMLQIYKGARDD